MTVPVIQEVVATYPEVKITVISKPFFKPIFNGIENVTFLSADVYGEHKGIKLFKLIKEAKNQQVTAVADLHNVLRSKILSACFKFKKYPVAVVDKGRAEKKELVAKTALKSSPLLSMHERYALVFKSLGLPIQLPKKAIRKRLATNPRIDTLLQDSSSKIKIGIAPFAAHQSKVYPLHLMKKVIEALEIEAKYTIYLFGGGSEEKKQLDAISLANKNCINVAGTLPFEEELSLISNLDLMVSMDSGNGHLAAMYGVPVITLWGVTHPYAGFLPFMQPISNSILPDLNKFPKIPTSIYGNVYPDGYENVMESIAPEQVFEKIKELAAYTSS